jgi:hypothetical protein
MKLTLAILPFIAWMLTSARAAVIALDVGVSALTSAAKTFDIDGDSITDFTFRGNGGICTDDEPTSTCVFAVTIQGRSGIEFLFNPALGGPARPLLTGDILGPGSTGIWASTAFFSLSVASVMHLLDPDPANSGYPDYLDGFGVYSIGFRQFSAGGEARYGWVDVALSMPVIGGDDSTPGALGIPRVLGIHFSDTLGEAVEFTPVPESSTSIGGVLLSVKTLGIQRAG